MEAPYMPLLEGIKSTHHQIGDRSRRASSAVQYCRAQGQGWLLLNWRVNERPAGRQDGTAGGPGASPPRRRARGRPPPRRAASRCVCRAWRALIDGRGLLRAGLLPRSLAGLFISYRNLQFAKFFARPSVDYDHGMPNSAILNHCNGLLLQYDWVCNPATDECATLPERPTAPRAGMEFVTEHNAFLAFDPTVSSHYEVFLIPSVPCEEDIVKRAACSAVAVLRSEWPPSPCIQSVFSSGTGLWEDRSFSRQGEEAAGTVAEVQLDQRFEPYRHAEYWRGALYIHCQTDFVIR
ncbi:hypothetical protein C2845_PM02G07850 [Panicum miliaceum]|uniref:F-box domain-containing protein n=1 Tax=Panicum miliaceum TaxID=4540 RepID=A0A3L6SH81_PANMI|nr:hypothetical protein C2845_PM02G07850 [Panicum miliaceum]